jgi:hypothetical protein
MGVHETSTWPSDILRHTSTTSLPQLNGYKAAAVTSTDDNFGEAELAEVGQTSASFGLQKLMEVAETSAVAPSYRRQYDPACGCLELASRT